MPCYHPLTAYYGKDVNPATGRRPLTFNRMDSHSGIPMQVPCGQCIGCRLERSRQWAVRCMHEKMMHEQSSFVTLTYDDKNLPADGGLVKRDLQLFMKRLRKKRDRGLRFFACGEYGEVTFRPHYHLLFFNTRFSDQKFYKNSGDNPLYVSDELSELWPFGHNRIGEVTFESAAYVARYCLKKVTGESAVGHYGGRSPEFVLMSRRPGIGFGYYEKFGQQAYVHDNVIVNGVPVTPPRYYDTKYELVDAKRLERLKRKRRRLALKHKADRSPARMRVRERFEELKAARFKREK